MIARHWDDFNVDGMPSFPNQSILNQQLETLPEYRFDSDDAEPITVLLLVAHESLQTLIQYTDERNQKLQEQVATIERLSGLATPPIVQSKPTSFYPLTASGMKPPLSMLSFPKPSDPTWHVPTGFVERSSGEIEVNLSSDAVFYPIKAHMTLYSFFNNYSTLLDRVAIRMNKLFSLNIRTRPDWGKLFDSTGVCRLRPKDGVLSTTTQRFHAKLTTQHVLDYRNILDHEGYLPIDVKRDDKNNVYVILLPSDPRDHTKPINIEAIPFAVKLLEELIEFLNEVYGLIIQRLTSSKPPW